MLNQDNNVDQNWEDVKDRLTPTNTNIATDQLEVMRSADIVYPDGNRSTVSEEISDKYETLVESFGGEEEVKQYYDVGARGVTIVVEQDNSPLFVVYGKEDSYSKGSGPLFGLANSL